MIHQWTWETIPIFTRGTSLIRGEGKGHPASWDGKTPVMLHPPNSSDLQPLGPSTNDAIQISNSGDVLISNPIDESI